jgi:hypothetical protein
MHENWPPVSHAYGCRCARCRRGDPMIERLADQTLSTALRHAQNRAESELGAESATPAGRITLPGKWSGWSGAVSLKVLFAPGAPKIFTQKPRPITDGYGLLYRVYEEHKQRPLYIGMAYKDSIHDRVVSHLRGVVRKSGTPAQNQQTRTLAARLPQIATVQSEIVKLQILTTQPALGLLKVQFGKVEADSGYTMSPKVLHVFEAALQVLEKPHSYVGSSRTFEELFQE